MRQNSFTNSIHLRDVMATVVCRKYKFIDGLLTINTIVWILMIVNASVARTRQLSRPESKKKNST